VGAITDFRIDYINEAGTRADRASHPTSEQVSGRLLSEVAPAYRENGVLDSYIRLVGAGGTYHDAIHYRHPDTGDESWTEINASKLEDGIVVQWRDTTARHVAEELTRRNENRYRSLVQATSAIVWRADPKGGFVDEQPQWAAFTGQTAAQYHHAGWWDAVHPEDRPAFENLAKDALRRKSLFEHTVRVRRFDGESRHMQFRAVPMLDDAGEITEWIGTYNDITERVEAEEALRHSETRFRRLYASNQLGVMFYNRNGRVSDPNDAFLHMIGWTRSQFDREGLNWRAITPPEWEKIDRDCWDRLEREGQCGPFEKEYIRRDGTRVPVLISGANLNTDDYEHGVACVVDLSRSKQVEEQLRQSQASLIALTESLELRVKERTAEAELRSQQLRALALDLAETESRERKRLANLLHDHFQQLISAAKLKAGLLRRSATDAKQIDSLRQMESLLEEAINASRSLATELSPPVLSDGGLLAAFDWVARKMEKDYGLRVQVKSDPSAEPDSDQVRRLVFECVRELLFNIVKHADTHEAELEARMSPEGLLVITIDDRGKGFDLANAMRRSTMAGQDGSFGLFSIRERLSLIGGLLNIKSRPGEGTHVEMSVPVGVKKPLLPVDSNAIVAGTEATSPPPGNQANEKRRHDASRPARILVADDHRLFREGLINLLMQESDITVVGDASDGQEAVELCRKLKPDILICDVTMPRLNGVQVAKLLRTEFPEIRVIGLSMHEREDMAHAMRAAGAVAYVTKSGASDQLLAVLRSVTSNQPLESN